MGLDVNTPLGIKSKANEMKMLKFVSWAWGVNIMQTNKNGSAACDGFIFRGDELSGIFESKCRNLSLDELEAYKSWLVTNEKIEKCAQLSKLLNTPFIGLLYLLKDNLIMYWQITDANGKYVFEFEVAETETRKTVNGGTATRKNAYLPFKNGIILQSLMKK